MAYPGQPSEMRFLWPAVALASVLHAARFNKSADAQDAVPIRRIESIVELPTNMVSWSNRVGARIDEAGRLQKVGRYVWDDAHMDRLLAAHRHLRNKRVLQPVAIQRADTTLKVVARVAYDPPVLQDENVVLAHYTELRNVLRVLARMDARQTLFLLETLVVGILELFIEVAEAGFGFDKTFIITSQILVHGGDVRRILLVPGTSLVPLSEGSRALLAQLAAVLELTNISQSVAALAKRIDDIVANGLLPAQASGSPRGSKVTFEEVINDETVAVEALYEYAQVEKKEKIAAASIPDDSIRFKADWPMHKFQSSPDDYHFGRPLTPGVFDNTPDYINAESTPDILASASVNLRLLKLVQRAVLEAAISATDGVDSPAFLQSGSCERLSLRRNISGTKTVMQQSYSVVNPLSVYDSVHRRNYDVRILLADDAEAFEDDGALFLGQPPNVAGSVILPQAKLRMGRLHVTGEHVVMQDFVIDGLCVASAQVDIMHHVLAATRKGGPLLGFFHTEAYMRAHHHDTVIVTVVYALVKGMVRLSSLLGNSAHTMLADGRAALIADSASRGSAICGLAEALRDLHAANVVHGYLCTETVLFDFQNRKLSLAAWSIAARTSFPLMRDIMGDREVWLAPEVGGTVAGGHSLSFASDVWALGVLIAQLSGARIMFQRRSSSASPFTLPTEASSFDSVDMQYGIVTDYSFGQRIIVKWDSEVLSGKLLAIVRDCLKAAPADRSSAVELVRRLHKLYRGEPADSDFPGESVDAKFKTLTVAVSKQVQTTERATERVDREGLSVTPVEPKENGWTVVLPYSFPRHIDGLTGIKFERVYEEISGANVKRGGFGEVTAVRHRYTGLTYAVKTVSTKREKDTSLDLSFDVAVHELRMMRALKSRHVMGALGGHIIVLADAVEVRIVMEVALGDVHACLLSATRPHRIQKAPAVAYARAVMAAAVSGLIHMHAQGIRHSDIKCKNILVLREGGEQSSRPETPLLPAQRTIGSHTSLDMRGIESIAARQALASRSSDNSLSERSRTPNATQSTTQGLEARGTSPADPLSIPGYRFKISDLGGATLMSQEARQKYPMLDGAVACILAYTPSFLPPEVLVGNHFDYPADVWALGISLLELLEGVAFFRASPRETTPQGYATGISWAYNHMLHAQGLARIPSSLVPEVVVGFLAGCLVVDKDARAKPDELLSFPLLSPHLPAEALDVAAHVATWLPTGGLAAGSRNRIMRSHSTRVPSNTTLDSIPESGSLHSIGVSASRRAEQKVQSCSPATVGHLSPRAVPRGNMDDSTASAAAGITDTTLQAVTYPLRFKNTWYARTIDGVLRETHTGRAVELRQLRVSSAAQAARDVMVATALAYDAPASLQRFIRAHTALMAVNHYVVVAVFEQQPQSLARALRNGPEGLADVAEVIVMRVRETLNYLHERHLCHGSVGIHSVGLSESSGVVLSNPFFSPRQVQYSSHDACVAADLKGLAAISEALKPAPAAQCLIS